MKGIRGFFSKEQRQRPDKMGISGLANFERAEQDLEVVDRLKLRRNAEKAEAASAA